MITGGGTGVAYQPNADYCNDGTPPTTSPTALNPGGSDRDRAVTVDCVDDAPARSTTRHGGRGLRRHPINALANDTDTDGGTRSVASVTQPAHGSAVIAGGGTGLTYQPNADYCNDGAPTDNFTYTLNGGSTGDRLGDRRLRRRRPGRGR